MKLPRDQVEALRPRDVRHYLAGRGWVADEAESSLIAAIYRNPTAGDAEVVLPLRRELGDYTLRMADVVQALAIVEDRPFLEILKDLSTPPGDAPSPGVPSQGGPTMNPEKLRNAHRLRPFKPFAIQMTSGSSYPVAEPEMMAMSPDGRSAVLMPDSGFIILDVAHVTRIIFEGREL